MKAIEATSDPVGAFTIEDYNLGTPTTLLTVTNAGDLEVTGTIRKAGAVELYNQNNTSALVDLFHKDSGGSKHKRMEFTVDTTNNFARMAAITSGYAMRVEGDFVDINTTNATGVIGKFLTNGTSRLTVEYNSSRADIKSASTIRIEGAGTQINHATTDSTMCVLQSTGVDRFSFAYASASTKHTLTTGTGNLRLETDYLRLNARGAGSTNMITMSSNSLDRWAVDWDSANAQVYQTSFFDYLITVSGDLDTSAENVRFKFGVGVIGTLSFVEGGGNVVAQVAETGAWSFKTSSAVENATLTPRDGNDDTVLDMGIDTTIRGKILLRRDQDVIGSNCRPGTFALQDNNGNTHYLWVQNPSGVVYQLKTSTTDPGSGTGGTTLLTW